MRNASTIAIKSFIKQKYPEEYRLHQFYNDWNRCYLTRQKVSYWTQKYSLVSKSERKKNAKLVGGKTTLSIINLTLWKKTKIVAKAVELKKIGVTKFCLGAIKWYLRLYHPDHFNHYRKFDNFEICSITRHQVRQWLRSAKKSALPPKLRIKLRANMIKKRERGI